LLWFGEQSFEAEGQSFVKWLQTGLWERQPRPIEWSCYLENSLEWMNLSVGHSQR